MNRLTLYILHWLMQHFSNTYKRVEKAESLDGAWQVPAMALQQLLLYQEQGAFNLTCGVILVSGRVQEVSNSSLPIRDTVFSVCGVCVNIEEL